MMQKSPSAHHRTTLSGYIFATKAHIDNRKKNLLSSNTSSTCPYNMVNFGPLVIDRHTQRDRGEGERDMLITILLYLSRGRSNNME